MNKQLLKIKNYLQTQLLLTLISLPILINFGIPLSVMSFIGNLLFVPFITLFLIFSSIIFFLELFNIPNSYPSILLNKLTQIFEITLKMGNKNWMFGFANINIIFIILIPIITIWILIHKNYQFLKLFFLLFFITIILYLNKPVLNKEYIPNTDQKLLIYMEDENIVLIDHGLFQIKSSPENYVNYELKPYLIKKYGILSIDSLELICPGVRSFKAVATLGNTIQLNTVIIHLNNKKLTKYAWKCFFDAKKIIENNNGIMVLI